VLPLCGSELNAPPLWRVAALRVSSIRCASNARQRKGRYSVRRLIEKYERNANLMKWREQLNGDCPKRDAPKCMIAVT
jgi:hypothetical protein